MNLTELDVYIDNNNLDGFKDFLNKKFDDNKNLFNLRWNIQGKQMTILAYLVSKHIPQPNDDALNLSRFIEFVNIKHTNLNSENPIHKAIRQNKFDLLNLFLKIEELDRTARDYHGQTLLAHALNTRDIGIIKLVCEQDIDIHQPSLIQIGPKGDELQPIHQAIQLNFSEAINELVIKGADLNASCGMEENRPIHLSAQFMYRESLRAMLGKHAGKMDLNAKNARQLTAIDILCDELKGTKNTNIQNNSLNMMAMLLCHGAKGPSAKKRQEILKNYKGKLLSAIGDYLASQKQSLVDLIKERCHDKNSKLHEIFYSSSGALRRIFGKPDKTARVIESWHVQRDELLEDEEENNELTETQKFSEFVHRYNLRYDYKMFTNPWSSMRWKISAGKVTTWSQVDQYAQDNPKSRTAEIVKDMKQISPQLHTDLENSFSEEKKSDISDSDSKEILKNNSSESDDSFDSPSSSPKSQFKK